jgi:hypothetical protein
MGKEDDIPASSVPSYEPAISQVGEFSENQKPPPANHEIRPSHKGN